MLGPNGGGKTTLFRALLGELPAARGRLDVAARVRRSCRRPSARGWTIPVSALDVALMGALARAAVVAAAGPRASAGGARRRSSASGLADQAGATFGELSGGQRQRVLIARALVQDAGAAAARRAVHRARRAERRRDSRRCSTRWPARAARVLIATHDVEQARAWDRVLCLNRRQVAFGAAAATC